ncbi:hypothetical protein [Actinocrispum sp. NPDC049592]|uniref:hypothetical protein n=1 Tax=Actinocrispum sp. NPDC049592 TaxID=3154835 RepID=UPI00344452AF
MPQSLDQFAGHLLIQCRPSQALAAAEVAKARHTGLVITGRSSEDTVRHLRAQGFDGLVLCDADRYSGTKRIPGRRGIHPAWCRRQHDLGLAALTDSGYLEPRDWIGLRTILRAAGGHRAPVVAMLPMAARWFATSAVCDAISREINKYEVPVAFAIEHSSDPFGVQYLLRGFLHVLRKVAVPVLLLRCDISALGALCHGAHAAAIGTISALRHFYPTLARGRSPSPGLSAFVSALLSYHKLETCQRVFEETSDMAQLWTCDCPVCDGDTPGRLAEAVEAGVAVFQHSLYAQLGLHAEIFRIARTHEEYVSIWHETCSHALYVHEQVAAVTEPWRMPLNLKSWFKVTDDPLFRAIIPHQSVGDGTAAAHVSSRREDAPGREEVSGRDGP